MKFKLALSNLVEYRLNRRYRNVADVERLSHAEKVFLAGCVKSMILSNSQIDESQIEDMERLFGSLGLPNYEEYLTEFEDSVSGWEDFFSRAEQITRPEARKVILESTYEVLIQDGLLDESEEGLFRKLSALWEP